MAVERKTLRKVGFQTRVENAMKNANNRSKFRAWWWRRTG